MTAALIGEAPDVYRCACRGLAEELGLHESVDFAVADITFLSFGVDTRYALRGLTGLIKVKKSIEKVLLHWENGTTYRILCKGEVVKEHRHNR